MGIFNYFYIIELSDYSSQKINFYILCLQKQLLLETFTLNSSMNLQYTQIKSKTKMIFYPDNVIIR